MDCPRRVKPRLHLRHLHTQGRLLGDAAQRQGPNTGSTRYWQKTWYVGNNSGDSARLHLIIEWRRYQYSWWALCQVVIDEPGHQPMTVMSWVAVERLVPVIADPNDGQPRRLT